MGFPIIKKFLLTKSSMVWFRKYHYSISYNETLTCIQVNIKGQVFNFLINTDAGDTFIDEKLARSLAFF